MYVCMDHFCTYRACPITAFAGDARLVLSGNSNEFIPSTLHDAIYLLTSRSHNTVAHTYIHTYYIDQYLTLISIITNILNLLRILRPIWLRPIVIGRV